MHERSHYAGKPLPVAMSQQGFDTALLYLVDRAHKLKGEFRRLERQAEEN